jgi:uncharacterized Zn finger protein
VKAADLLRLSCPKCGWLPDDDVTMGVVRAHMKTEHDGADVTLDLVVVCPVCGIVAPLTRDDGRRTIHDCPACKRTYRIPHGTTA